MQWPKGSRSLLNGLFQHDLKSQSSAHANCKKYNTQNSDITNSFKMFGPIIIKMHKPQNSCGVLIETLTHRWMEATKYLYSNRCSCESCFYFYEKMTRKFMKIIRQNQSKEWCNLSIKYFNNKYFKTIFNHAMFNCYVERPNEKNGFK